MPFSWSISVALALLDFFQLRCQYLIFFNARVFCDNFEFDQIYSIILQYAVLLLTGATNARKTYCESNG